MMAEFNFEKINAARKLLGLSSEATVSEIKEAYRTMVKRHHPDRYLNEAERRENEKRMAEINRAYELLLSYIEEYKISFRKEDVERCEPERDMKRFYQDWLEGR